jgi:hypothetical protein
MPSCLKLLIKRPRGASCLFVRFGALPVFNYEPVPAPGLVSSPLLSALGRIALAFVLAGEFPESSKGRSA